MAIYTLKRLPTTGGNQLIIIISETYLGKQFNLRVEDKIFKASRQKDKKITMIKDLEWQKTFQNLRAKQESLILIKLNERRCELRILHECKMPFKYQDYRKNSRFRNPVPISPS